MEALFYEQLNNGVVRCRLCPHHCQLQDGQTGLCGVRVNTEGRLNTINYGQVSALAVDPIEKKPLYHFYPGAMILSAGSFGCNFDCAFCQNYHISRQIPDLQYVAPDTLAALAQQYRREGSIGIAFTYNEPSIWYEYILAVAPLLREQGLKTVLVSNGFIGKEPLQKLMPFIDAVNIDVKAFNDQFYRRLCHGKLDAVKENVETLIASPVHTEITTLIIPGENDREEEISALCRWLSTLDANTVLHLSRYHPAYKMKNPSTPEETMRRSHEIAKQYLRNVYIGNLPGEENNTYCEHCGNLLIHRSDYQTSVPGITKGVCSRCHNETAIPPAFFKVIT